MMERQMILEMLADGKIEVSEALELLKAVGESQVASSNQRGSSEQAQEPDTTQGVNATPVDTQKIVAEKVTQIKEATSQIKKELANEWEKAEAELRSVKETYRRANDLEREIENIQEDNLDDEQEQDTFDKEQMIKDMQAQKEELVKAAKEQAQSAQEQMLEVRRRIKEKGYEIGEIVNKDLMPEMQRTANVAQDVAQQFGDTIGDTIEEITSKIGPFIDQFVSGISFGGFEGHEVVRETTWQPENDGDLIDLNAQVQNGQVIVYGVTDRKDIGIKLEMKIRASEGQIEEIADGLVSIMHQGNQLNVEVVRKFNTMHRVNVTLLVPVDRIYNCNLQSVNGKVIIDNLQGGDWFLKTANGRIIVGKAQAKQIDATSSNGSLRFNAQAEVLNLSASNGTIKYYPPQGAYGLVNLQTRNGGIRINGEPGINAIIDGSTKTSKVKLNDNWQTISSNKSKVGHKLSAASVDFDPTLPHLKITASTKNGSVKIIDDLWENN